MCKNCTISGLDTITNILKENYKNNVLKKILPHLTVCSSACVSITIKKCFQKRFFFFYIERKKQNNQEKIQSGNIFIRDSVKKPPEDAPIFEW